MNEITRHLDNDFFDEFINGKYSEIRNIAWNHQCLILPREDKVIIYYQGCKVLEINKKQDIKLKNAYVKNKNICDPKIFFEDSILRINDYKRKSKEKTKQQDMFSSINKAGNYFVFDMEYQKHKKIAGKKTGEKNDNPRVDLVAVRKEDRAFVCVELKVKNAALTGNQGIVGHLQSAEKFKDFTKNEFEPMINQVTEINKLENNVFTLDWDKKVYIFALIDCEPGKLYRTLSDKKCKTYINSLNSNGWEVCFTDNEDLSDLKNYDDFLKIYHAKMVKRRRCSRQKADISIS